MKFIFFGNTSFTGFPQREHAFAIELAERGYDVTFIEGMPSVGSKLQDVLFGKWKKNILQTLPKSLHILIPPIIPTMFRSSYTPTIDRIIFRSWMKKQFDGYDWSETIGIATFPYWWYGFVDRKTFPVKKLIYDSCDSLVVPSRTSWALERMKSAEVHLLREADAITYSAHEMREKYLQYHSYCITNAIAKEIFLKNNFKYKKKNSNISIGYIGSIDERWIDVDLILYIAEKYPSGTVHIYGHINNKYLKKFQKYINIILHGYISHKKISIIFEGIDVSIIPFVKNEITDFVNPLKLYEYSSFGIPIIAVRTRELNNYSSFIYLADSKEQFVQLIQKAITENTNMRIQQRISFASENTWDHKISELLKVITSL